MRSLRCLGIACALASACEGGSSTEDGTGDRTGGDPTGGAPTGGDPTGGDPTDGEMVPLVTPLAWMQTAAADDPLADHRPAAVMCPLGAWIYEMKGLEINTATCNYAMFSQPALVGVAKGARLRASLYHFDLIAAEPATAHVALLIGEVVVWEQEVSIPGKANAFTIDFPSPMAWSEGTLVHFHLHNHGQNTWTMGSIEVEVAG